MSTELLKGKVELDKNLEEYMTTDKMYDIMAE